MKNYLFLIFAVSSLSLTTSASSLMIPVISFNNNKTETVKLIPKDKLLKSMTHILGTVGESVTSQVTTQKVKVGKLRMKRFGVGIGFSGKIGVGPWSIGAGITQKMFFTN